MHNEKKQLILLICDGLGLPPKNDTNKIVSAKTMPFLFGTLWNRYPHTSLIAHGENVGLLKDQEGNSEAGHLNIGAGRVVKQDIRYVHDAIEDGTFFKNTAILEALHHAKKYKSKVHVMGLLSNGNSAHASPQHLKALLTILHDEGVKKVFLHLFTDGRDSRPHEALTLLKKCEENFHGTEKVATVIGRFYAMDRNKRWERTQKAYEAMTQGKGCAAPSAYEAVSQAYNRGETDEFICPCVVMEKKKPVATVDDDDVVIFFNLRSDRARQMTKPFVQGLFETANLGAFRRKKRPNNIRFVVMTDFGPDLPGIATAFPSHDVHGSLTQMLCHAGFTQSYIAESEKYAHITYFFNGGYGHKLYDEEWVRIASPNVAHYEKTPAMSTVAIRNVVIARAKKACHFVAANFASADMIGHTGNEAAARKALTILDASIKTIVKKTKKDATIIVTADHGNVEWMHDATTNEVITEHTKNPVPFILISNEYRTKRLRGRGRLADIAPTILQLLKIPKQKEMTGKSLL